MVRRYVPRGFMMIDSKLEDLLQPGKQPQQPPTRNLRASGQNKVKVPAEGVSDVSGGHNAAADGRITTTRRVAAAAVTAVPNPTPDTGVAPNPASSSSSVNTLGAGAPLLGALTVSDTATSGYTVVQPSTKVSVSPMPRTAVVSFSALPPLESFVLDTSDSIDAQSLYPSQTSPTPSSSATSAPSDANTRQMSVALVILLSVGGACLLLGFCIMAKMCTRPRRVRPTPSLPIIKDVDSDEDFYEGKESPIFGGQERLSAALGNNPGWNWVTYPHVKSTSRTQPPDRDHSCPSGQQPRELQQHHVQQQQAGHTLTDNPALPENRFNLATQPPASSNGQSVVISGSSSDTSIRPVMLQNMAAVAQTNKRLSRASLAMYATNAHGVPPSQTQQETSFTGDDHDVTKRSKSKADVRRRSQYGQDDRKHRNSATSFIGLAYDGDESPSPAPAEYSHVVLSDTPMQSSDFEGRARVKSGYFATGSYPRHSVLPSTSYSIATATRINVANRNSLINDKLSSHQHVASKRVRDTQALSYALGLTSPRTEYGPASPQPTLYPDDSMSVSDAARRQKKRNVGGGRPAEPVPDVPVIVPLDRAGGSTDGLMSMSFSASQMSLNLPKSQSEESISRIDLTPASTSTRNFGDRVPRVPSPPPLPSLAQMGLQRAAPEAYDSYRSPTYSLYGLYQSSDRKSCIGRS
ncbi:hypothetical protein D9619_005442 [Psilocybe cf. subviscida]|uniref:Transmembrane protein n=1 Tax=Psilocybe cf. subviscida TaxID=2480587 RepID=A0A8H5BWA8_9AGAR|nr:hypothetical protein D9619_005442 [Psilocybe cf. subviscida]